MKKIPSFTINHEDLLRGIYVSRKDFIGEEAVTTFDIRMKEPNREPALSPEAAHTLEHLGATFLRNSEQWKEQIVYWGPMGCMTGFYFLMKGNRNSAEIVELLKDTYRFMADFEGEIPGATPRDCGNYAYQDLASAKKEAKKFLDEVLNHITEANLVYPK